MNEEERLAMQQYLEELGEHFSSGGCSVKEACEDLLKNAAKVKEMEAAHIQERGFKGYDQYCDHVKESTLNNMSKVLFHGTADMTGFMLELYDKGVRGEELLNQTIARDTTGRAAMMQDRYREALPYLLQAREYDRTHVKESYDLASAKLNEKIESKVKPERLDTILRDSGIEKNNGANPLSEQAHQILADRAVNKMNDESYGLPRWAKCLLLKPGMKDEEKQALGDKWNRDQAGKDEICEMFISEIENMDPSMLDVNNLEDYMKNFDACSYYGNIAFERELFKAEFKLNNFSVDPKRWADFTVVSKAMAGIQNKFNMGMEVMENPLAGYIKDIHNLTMDQVGVFFAMSQAPVEDVNDQAQISEREELMDFSGTLLNYTGNEIIEPTKAKEILAYNKKPTAQELQDWYKDFKDVLAAQGVDLSNPVDMTRLKAKVPGKEGQLYMPAMKGLNADLQKPGKPALPDIPWYGENMTAANDLSEEQIANLYDLTKQGALAIFGKEMDEPSMHFLYNDKGGKPQFSRSVYEIDAGNTYKDEEKLAEEMFPDAVHPGRVYEKVLDFHAAFREETPSSINDEEPDFEETVRVAFDRTLLGDYLTNKDKYADPQSAQERTEQVYTVTKYNYGKDADFNSRYEKYMEENGKELEPEEKVLTPQEKAIASINDPRLNEIKVPEITQEMVDFANSIEPLLDANGWNMERYADRACVNIFADSNGTIRKIPTCASLNFKEGNGHYLYKGVEDEIHDEHLTPEERVLCQSNRPLRFSGTAESINNGSTTSSEKIRIAMLYEYGKKGMLLATKPGEPTSSAVPIIPGKDGKAQLVTNLENFSDKERKQDIYINATRVRRLYNDPNEAKLNAHLKTYVNKVDSSIYTDDESSMDKVSKAAYVQADSKGLINDKEKYLDMVLALTPKVHASLETIIENRNEELEENGDELIDLKLKTISPKDYAKRREISDLARKNYFSVRFDTMKVPEFAREAAKQGIITEKQAQEFNAIRGYNIVFLEHAYTPENMKINLERINTLFHGTPEEKNKLFNERLEAFSSYDPSPIYDMNDEQLANNWPEIDMNCFRLQELIRMTDFLEQVGIHPDPQKLAGAMKAERNTGDIYYYLSNRMQAIVNPAYEKVDIDQLLDVDSSTGYALTDISSSHGDRETARLISNLNTARSGRQLAAKTTIANYFVDELGAKDTEVDFYDKDCKKIDLFQVYDQLVKGNEVFAAHKGDDQTYAFKAQKGKFKAEPQPSAKYAKKLNSITQMRKETRLAEEEKERRREYEKFLKDAEKNNKRIADIRTEREQRKNAEIEYDGEALNYLFEGYPEEPEPVKPEKEIVRDNVQSSLKEEIEYQQYKLGLIVDSYGPTGMYKDKVEDYKTFSQDCALEILALSKALEKSEKGDISKADLEQLTSKKSLGEIKKQLLKDDAVKMALEGLDTDKLKAIVGADKEGPEKFAAAENVKLEYNKSVAVIEQQKKDALARQKQQYKDMARDAMKSGIDKYKEFGKKLDEVIDYGQYKLGAGGRSIQAKNKGAETITKECLAELFAAVTVKDILDNNQTTYKQAEALSSPKALKNASKEILADPAFTKLFDNMKKTPETFIKAGAQKEDGSFDRSALKEIMKNYTNLRKEMKNDKKLDDKQQKIDVPKKKKDDLIMH